MDRNLRRQAKSNKYKQTNIGGERETVNEWVSERTNERASDKDNDHHLCRCICIHTYTYNVDGPQWQHQKPDINFICHRNSRAFLLFFILSLCVADENREFEFHSLWKINWNSDENYSIAVQLKLDKKYALINHVFRFQFFGVEKSNRPHNLENTNVPNITSFIQHTHSIVQALTLSTHTHTRNTHTHNRSGKTSMAFVTAILYTNSVVYYVQVDLFENDSLVIHTHICYYLCTIKFFFLRFYCSLVRLSLSLSHTVLLTFASNELTGF